MWVFLVPEAARSPRQTSWAYTTGPAACGLRLDNVFSIDALSACQDIHGLPICPSALQQFQHGQEVCSGHESNGKLWPHPGLVLYGHNCAAVWMGKFNLDLL